MLETKKLFEVKNSMYDIERTLKLVYQAEMARFILNGIIATGVHFSILTLNLQVYGMQSAGMANLTAAIFGITVSFLGSRYFVFKKHQEPIISQVVLFLLLYASIACMHGLVLYVWTDVSGFDYRSGFVFATILQVSLSYWGNKSLVFKK